MTHDLFAHDALVFKNIASRVVGLKNRKGSQNVVVEFRNFKELGIWAKPGAPFVCIEPWLGYADSETGHEDISEKAGIQYVEHGHVFEAAYNIFIK